MKRIIATGLALGVMVNSASAADFLEETGYRNPHNLAASLDAAVGYHLLCCFLGGAAGDGLDKENFAAGLNGRVSIPFGVFSLQLDAEADFTTAEVVDLRQYKSHVLGAVHLNWRDPSRGLAGGFGGIGRAEAIGAGPDPSRVDFWFAGIEGQLYTDLFTFYAQAGYFDASLDGTGNPLDPFHNAWFLRGVGRYFPSDTTMIQAELSFAHAQQDETHYDSNIWGWGAKVEHAIGSWPMTGFLAYEGAFYDAYGAGSHFSDHLFLAGVSLRFGAPNVKINDRFGTTLDVPNIARWATAGLTLD
jgi:hypothetical protein